MRTRMEKDLSRWLDGELPPRRARAVEAHLAAHPEVASQVEAWKQIGTRLRDERLPAGPTPEAAWADVCRSLRMQQDAGRASETSGLFGRRLAWAGGLLALLLLLNFLGYGLWTRRDGQAVLSARTPGAGSPVVPVEVEWVETESPGSTAMVYQDAETGLTVIWMVEADTKEAPDADS